LLLSNACGLPERVCLHAEEEAPSSFFSRLAQSVNSKDPHHVIDEDEATRTMHDNAEVFDERAEGVFRYLQARTRPSPSKCKSY
jgi:hypothetical protein